MDPKGNDLNNLRLAILKHQWKEAYPLLSLQLARNLPQCTVLVADHIARSCLRFQTRYDLGWIIRFTQEVIQFIQDGQVEHRVPNLPHQTGETFADAPHGVPNLVGGVEELWRSFEAHNTDEKANHLANAINRFIVAEIGNYWETVHPEEVRLREIFSNAETTSEGKKLLPADINKKKLYSGIGYLKQPESVGYHSARLLSLVDEIELVLSK